MKETLTSCFYDRHIIGILGKSSKNDECAGNWHTKK